MSKKLTEKRFDILIKKLGLTDYDSLDDIVFWDIDDDDAGILQKISRNKDKQLEDIRYKISALMDYLDLEFKDIEIKSQIKVVKVKKGKK